MNQFGNLEGLIPIIGGIYMLLLACGVLPLKTNKPEEWVIWRRKFKAFIFVSCPLIILLGCLRLFGIVQ